MTKKIKKKTKRNKKNALALLKFDEERRKTTNQKSMKMFFQGVEVQFSVVPIGLMRMNR